jgi:hypothetical protein
MHQLQEAIHLLLDRRVPRSAKPGSNRPLQHLRARGALQVALPLRLDHHVVLELEPRERHLALHKGILRVLDRILQS